MHAGWEPDQSSSTQASDFRVGQICGNRYVIHLGRWSRVWKRYQGGRGGGLQLHLPCPMPPSAVAAGPVKKNGSDSDFWPFSGRPPQIGGLGRASADGAVLPNPPGPLFRPQTGRPSEPRAGPGGLVRPLRPPSSARRKRCAHTLDYQRSRAQQPGPLYQSIL